MRSEEAKIETPVSRESSTSAALKVLLSIEIARTSPEAFCAQADGKHAANTKTDAAARRAFDLTDETRPARCFADCTIVIAGYPSPETIKD
ncbi:MAG TPA: hypothetical protein PLN33_01290 [Hyphomonadaceae bacterium]|nr:hypothetical protein [Hyphomonadaceae bacterium]HPN04293.1 hypothetical protein [Hyphomonadaceae bacterium]